MSVNKFGDKNIIKSRQLISWSSIIILWIGIFYCGINQLLDETKEFAALFFLIISTAITYLNFKQGVRLTLLMTLLGAFNLLVFFPFQILLSFGFGELGIGFELVLFLIVIIHLFTNRNEFSRILNSEISNDEINSINRSQIDGFKKRFSSRSIKELEILAKNQELVPEAINAAKELLEEKSSVL